MRFIIPVFAIVATVGLFASCKKCQTCTVSDGAAVFGTPTNVCGSKKDREKQQNNCITSASTISGTKCTCTED